MSPVDYRRYPDNWHDEIRPAILERAGHQCEWCGVENYAVGARDRHGKWWNEDDIHMLNSDAGRDLFEAAWPKIIKIVLTIAHLGTDHADGTPGDKHDKLDCRPENLAALCQRCHLLYDMDEHIENRRKTLLRKKLDQIKETGQMMLFNLGEVDDE